MPDTTQTLATKFTADVKDALDGINRLKESFSSLITASDLFNREMAESTSAVSSFASIVSKATAVVQSFQDRLEKTVNESGKLSGAMHTAAAGMDSIKEGVSGSAQATNEYSKAVGIINEQFKGNKVAIDNIVKELNKLENNYHALNNQGIDTKRVLDGEYNAINLVSKAYDNWGGKAKSAVPMFENVGKANKALTTGLSDTEFKLTDLGKAFFATSSKGQAFFDALVTGGKQFGVHTEATSRYSKALIDAHTHLSNLPQSSANYDTALKELGDSSLLNVKAMELMNGEIARSKDGFIALNDEALVSGTTMNAYGQRLIELESVHKNLRSALENYTKSHKTNDIAVQNAGETLSKYGTAMQTVKSEQKLLADQLSVSGRSFTDLNGNILSTEQATAKLRAEKGQLTNFLQNETNMLKFLDSGYEASREGLMRFAAENLKGSHSVQEFYKELNGLNAGLEKVGQYGTKYVDALRETTKETFTNKGAVEEAVKTHLKYAQAAESLIEQHKNVTKSLQENATQAKATAAGFNDLDSYTRSLGEAHDKFAGHLRDTGTILNLTSSANTVNAESMLNNAKAANTGAEAIDRLHESSFKHLKMLPEHADLINNLNAEIDKKNITTQQAEKILKAETATLEANRKAALENEAAQKRLSETVNKQSGFFQNLIVKVKELSLYYAASAILFGLTLAFREGVKAIVDFDQSLHSLKAITNATNTEINALGDTMQEIARNSRYSASQVADGMQIMGQAGLDSVQIMNSIQGATDLATGTMEKMDMVVDLITTTMTVFGKNALETTEIVDSMAVAINKSKSTVDKLRTAFNYVGVTAGQAKLSLQETSASIMVLNDAGMKGSTTGTSFRQVLQKLIAPNEKLRVAYREAGIEIEKVNPLTAGYEKALESLSSVLWDSENKVVRVALAIQLFGTRGAQAASALVRAFNTDSGGYKEAIDSLYESGEASRMAAEQMEGLQAKAENLVSRLKELAITLGESGLSSLMSALIDIARGLVEAFRQVITVPIPGFISSINSELTIFVGAIAAAIVAINTYNWALGTTLVNLTGIIPALKSFYTILTGMYIANPVLMTVAFTVAAVILSFKNLQNQLENATISLGRESLEAKKTADTFLVLKDNLIKAKEGTVAYEAQLRRFGLEHKNLTERILEQTKATTLADIGYQKLIDTIDLLYRQDATESFKKTAESIGALKSEIAFLETAQFLLYQTTGHLIDYTDKIKGKYDVLDETLKKITKNVFEYVKGLKLTDAQTLEYIKSLGLTGANLEKVKNGIAALTEMQIIQNAQIKESGQSMLEGMEDIYSGLTAVQKTEITKMAIQLNEELVQFQKWAKDHEEIVENSEAVRSGIVLKWQLKALDKLSEFSKKTMEIEEERYVREQEVYNRQLGIIQDYINKAYAALQVAEGDKKNLKENASQEEIDRINKDYQNAKAQIEIGEQILQDKIIEKKRSTLESVMKLQTEYISGLQTILNTEVSVFASSENEKLKKKVEFAQKNLETVQSSEQSILQVYGQSSSKYREYLQKELDAKREVVEAQKALIEEMLSKYEEAYDGMIQHISDKAQAERDVLKSVYEEKLSYLKQEKDAADSLLNSSNKTYIEKAREKEKIHKGYLDNVLKEMENYLNESNSILDKEGVALQNALGEKYKERVSYEVKVQEQILKTEGYTQTSLYRETKETKESMTARQQSWFEFRGKVYEILDSTSIHVKEKAAEESKAVVDMNKAKLESEINITKQRKDLLKEVYDEAKRLLGEEKSRYNELLGEKQTLLNQLKTGEEKYAEYERGLRRSQMTDIEKYYDDMKKAKELTNKALAEGDVKYLEDAADIYAKYTGDITEESKKVVTEGGKSTTETVTSVAKSSAEVTANSMKEIQNLANLHKQITQNQLTENEKGLQSAEAAIKKLEGLVKSYGTEIKKVTEQEITLKDEAAKKSFDELIAKATGLQTEIDKFKDMVMEVNTDKFKEQLEGLRTDAEKLRTDLATKSFEIFVSILGKEDKSQFETMIDDANKKAQEMDDKLSVLDPEIKALIKANPSESDTDKKSFNEVLDGLVTKTQTVATELATTPMEATVKVKGFDGESTTVTSPTTLLDTIKQKADALVDKAVTYTITVLGLDDLLKAVEKQNELKDTSVTHTINVHTVYTSSGDSSGGGDVSSSSEGSYATSEGGADIYHLGGIVKGLAKFAAGGFTGQLKGFGGGDIVPALLEPGEFVLRKEAVKKYGTDLFRMFNDMRTSDLMTGLFNKKFSIGGSVFSGLSPTSYQPPQTSSSSKQMDLHVIEFKVDNSSHQLYGEKNTITSLIQNMRRARLVTV